MLICGWQNLDEAHSSPGLHAAAGPGLAEECATLVSFTCIHVCVCIIFLCCISMLLVLFDGLLCRSFSTNFFSFFVNKFICLILGWLSNRNGKSYQCIRSSCKVGLSVVSLEQINVLLYSCKEESLVTLMLQSLIVFIVTLHRRIIHTVGPKYAVKYHTAAENALSHCYRSCLELLIENGLQRLVA